MEPLLMLMLEFPYPTDLLANVPFYKINGIPEVLYKKDVRNQKDNFVHDKLRTTNAKLTISSTSGSSGSPLEFYTSPNDTKVIHNCYCRLYPLLDNFSYKSVSIRHFDVSDSEDRPLTLIKYQPPKSTVQIYHKFRFLSSKETCDDLTRLILKDQPELIEGYATSIYLVAKMLLKSDRLMKNVKVISPSGEFLVEDVRNTIHQAFPNAAIYDRYGAEELGALAWECPLCGNYHFNGDFYSIERIAQDQVKITKRYVSAFQLANYNIEDNIKLVGFGNCEIQLPIIRILSGRKDDVLIDQTGAPLPIMPYHFGDLKELIQWQIIQQQDLSLDVNVIVEKESKQIAESIESHTRDALRGFELPIRINFVRKLRNNRKFKRVISLVVNEEFTN